MLHLHLVVLHPQAVVGQRRPEVLRLLSDLTRYRQIRADVVVGAKGLVRPVLLQRVQQINTYIQKVAVPGYLKVLRFDGVLVERAEDVANEEVVVRLLLQILQNLRNERGQELQDDLLLQRLGEIREQTHTLYHLGRRDPSGDPR